MNSPTSRPRARHGVCSLLPAGFDETELPVRLHVGSQHLLLRRLEPRDAEHLMAFFRSHTEQTILQRYGHACVRMTAERAAELVGVDQSRDAALGLFDHNGTAERLVAVGRYCLSRDGRTAEVAFVVHEAWRRLGLGTTLLAALIAIARQRRLDRLVALVQHDNGPMLAMLRAAGATLTWPDGEAEVHASLRLDAGDDCASAAAARNARPALTRSATRAAARPSRPPRRNSRPAP